jgi:hypothetical protein
VRFSDEIAGCGLGEIRLPEGAFRRLESMLFGYVDWQSDWWINCLAGGLVASPLLRRRHVRPGLAVALVCFNVYRGVIEPLLDTETSTPWHLPSSLSDSGFHLTGNVDHE